MKSTQTTNTKSKSRKRKEPKVKAGDNVLVNNKLCEVAEILSATGSNGADKKELEKPDITVYRIHKNITLKNNPIYVGREYELVKAA